METDEIAKGEQFILSSGGNPLMITVGCPDNKANRRSVKQVSLQMIKELQIVLELSLNKTGLLISTLRKRMGSKLAVENNIFGKMSDLEESLSYFYQVEKVNFFDSTGGTSIKDLVFVQDTSSFILDLIIQRCLDPQSAFVRISMDAGGGFMKVIVNVFDVNENTTSNLYLNSGVQRCQILSIVEDVQESNFNLRIILKKLNLQDVKFSAAFDLKCANAVFGISSHAGKKACLWCEGDSSEVRGKLRTLGSLDYWYQRYTVENSSKKSNMQHFMNVIYPRILYLDEDPDTLIQHLVPPPELHILIGIVTTLGCLLLDLWPGFDIFLKNSGVLQRGYQGRGWDGNNSNQILKCVDELERVVLYEYPDLLPIVQCLKDLKIVKDSCFGRTLELGHQQAILKFKNSFLSAQEIADILGKKLSISWKVHILLCHVQPFVEHHKCGLSKFAEQCGESVHSKFKPTWNRFKRQVANRIWWKTPLFCY
ncbi:uncharacterized protein LOC124814833 [Hydra vulgaris]|uniref:uncharacterized protein LOC124814833 n=1 Tax=Hydra vulgaris TaxID=6087 RepID=UPI001F5E3791|nr:uncharacterized protein LOC124814833 isoform X1 [Hydra vulgaris]